MFKEALAVMGSAYASAMGTTVMRHEGIPPMHASQQGKLMVIPAPGSDIDTEAALRAALGTHGAIESVNKDDDGLWLVHFTSHASVEAAIAAGLEGASAMFPVYNGRAYWMVRGRVQRPLSPHTRACALPWPSLPAHHHLPCRALTHACARVRASMCALAARLDEL